MKHSEKPKSDLVKEQSEPVEKRGNTEKDESPEVQTSRSEPEKNLSYNPEVTKEDLDALQHDNIHTDGGDDEFLRERIKKVDFTGSDLDVPGSKTARELRKKGMPDEENQLFSQGGPDKENLEEDDSAL